MTHIPPENVYSSTSLQETWSQKYFPFKLCQIYDKVEYSPWLVFADIVPMENNEQSRDKKQQFGEEWWFQGMQ